jgi:hypothetical protein
MPQLGAEMFLLGVGGDASGLFSFTGFHSGALSLVIRFSLQSIYSFGYRSGLGGLVGVRRFSSRRFLLSRFPFSSPSSSSTCTSSYLRVIRFYRYRRLLPICILVYPYLQRLYQLRCFSSASSFSSRSFAFCAANSFIFASTTAERGKSRICLFYRWRWFLRRVNDH